MSRAEQIVSQEIVAALQAKIGLWQGERQKIDSRREQRLRKEERYELLGQLIDEAQAQIDAKTRRADAAGEKR